MSGSRYDIFMAPSAHRRFEKFNPQLRDKIKEEAQRLALDPHACEERNTDPFSIQRFLGSTIQHAPKSM